MVAPGRAVTLIGTDLADRPSWRQRGRRARLSPADMVVAFLLGYVLGVLVGSV